MFAMINNLAKISIFKANRAVENANAVDLIDLKIRESEQNLSSAKHTLAALIVRQRSEKKALERIRVQCEDLEDRARQAMEAGEEGLAENAAQAIAELLNEQAMRQNTLDNLSERINKFQFSIEKAHRRLVSLKQGAVCAKAAVVERQAQRRVDQSLNTTSTFHEAEELIERITSQSDPFEETGILDEIDAGLDNRDVVDRMANAGFGPATRINPEEVLKRLKTGKQKRGANKKPV